MDHLFPGNYFPPPLVVGVALSRYNPSPSGTGLDEPPLGYNYQRVATYASWWTWSIITFRIYNDVVIEFPEASGDWGTITHFALFDSANYGTGNMLFYGELSSPTEIVQGCRARFETVELSVYLD